MEQNKNKWWGYKHTNGTIQAKRFFSQEDIAEAHESPFVDLVVYPFDAADREEALKYIEEQTK